MLLSRNFDERYRHLVETFPDAVTLHALDGSILLCNQHAATLLGCTREELAGKDGFLLLAPEERTRALEHLREATEKGSIQNIEHTFVRSDGRRVAAELSATLLRDAAGNPEALLAVVRDVTERKRAEERFRLAVEAAPNAMIAVDREGVIVLVNSQTEQLFGYTRQELLGQTIECLVPDRFRRRHPEYRREFAINPRTRPMGDGRELYGRKKNGDEMPVEIGLNPFPAHNEGLTLVSIIDVTVRKQLENLRNEFLATLTHDIRGPVANISGLLEIVQATEGLPGEASALLASMESSVRSLFALVSNCLEKAKIEAGELVLDREPFDLNEVVMRVVAQYASETRRRGVAIETVADGRLLAYGDKLATERICANLLRNAIQFTPAAGRIRIETARERDLLAVAVSDTGPGIAAGDLPLLFQPYRQTVTGRGKRGTGLGLFIVKSLSNAQGGSVVVESTPGAGTRFTVRLPAAARL